MVQAAKQIQCSLEYTTLKRITQTTEIYYDPDPTVCSLPNPACSQQLSTSTDHNDWRCSLHRLRVSGRWFVGIAAGTRCLLDPCTLALAPAMNAMTETLCTAALLRQSKAWLQKDPLTEVSCTELWLCDCRPQ